MSDAGTAALLAEAACKGAVYNVRINVAAMPVKGVGKALLDEAASLMHDCASAAVDAEEAVELAIGA